MLSILWTIAVILLIIWIIGLIVHVTVAAFHLLLVVAIILAIWGFFVNRRTAL